MKKKNILLNLAFILLAAIVYFINPLAMGSYQRIVLSVLIFVTATWATNSLDKSISCIILLLAFVIFGNTNPIDIISQVWGDTILLIMTTTLLSIGMMKTGIIENSLRKLLLKTGGSTLKMLVIPYVLGVALIFLIPQAFARVTILGTILSSLFVANNENEQKAKEVLIFNAFIAITMTYMLFSNGDIVLNQAAIGFQEGVVNNLSFAHWFKMMSIPTVLTSIVTLFVVKFGFKEELSYFNTGMIKSHEDKEEQLSPSVEKTTIVLILAIVIMWMAEPLHGIKPWLIALIGVAIMYGLKVLEVKDLKNINPHFILFLVTVFTIGKGLGEAGVTNGIFNSLQKILPSTSSLTYLIVLSVVVMVLHLLIGSSVATMSVILPIILPLAVDLGYRPEIITLTTYTIVNIHFLLPYHHATVMIGTAREFYNERFMLRFGAIMTPVTFGLLYFVFFKYWQLIGLL